MNLKYATRGKCLQIRLVGPPVELVRTHRVLLVNSRQLSLTQPWHSKKNQVLSDSFLSTDTASEEGYNEMRLANNVAILFLMLAANCVWAQNQSPSPLATLQAAYQAVSSNLVSGFGTGSYEIYIAPAGKESQQELKLKAKTKVFFDRGKFHIRFDYEKDDIHRLDSRIIIYDGTAILVSRISKHIHPAGSEGDIYEAKPTHHTLVKACFDYNPCQLPLSILNIDWLSDPKYASNLSIEQDANNDYSGSYVFARAPRHLRATFLATHRSGYNINTHRVFLTDCNDHLYITCHAEWERKKNIWYVKTLDTEESPLGGRHTERSIFKYTNFEPNVDVSPELFKFEALSLTPNARVIDRRPNVEESVLHQSQPASVDTAKLDTLADSVKSLTPNLKHAPPPPRTLLRYFLLVSGALLCVLGLLQLWRRWAKKRDITPETRCPRLPSEKASKK